MVRRASERGRMEKRKPQRQGREGENKLDKWSIGNLASITGSFISLVSEKKKSFTVRAVCREVVGRTKK